MTPRVRLEGRQSWRWLLLACVAGLAAVVPVQPAQAQFGFGFGWGMYPYTPESVRFLYGQSNIRSQAAYARQQQSLRAPDRFAYRDQQVAFDLMNRYDVSSRRSVDSSVDRRPPPPQAAPSAPVLPITSFFNDQGQLIWPGDAPTEGDLSSLRDIADDSIQEVYKEFQEDGFATVGTVTDARTRLIDYGQPALQSLRQSSTSRVSDTFHLFLLSLYDALAQAATPPRAVTGATPEGR